MLKIALGTTSEWKIRAVKTILSEISCKAKIITVEADSEVNFQPRTEKETQQGSINRAKNALAKVPQADFALGIEVGYEPINNKYYMHGVSSIVDCTGVTVSEQSSTLELPKYFYKYLHDHEEGGVGFHVEEYENLSNDPAWKYFTQTIRYREPFIKESARNALLRYIFREEYK